MIWKLDVPDAQKVENLKKIQFSTGHKYLCKQVEMTALKIIQQNNSANKHNKFEGHWHLLSWLNGRSKSAKIK